MYHYRIIKAVGAVGAAGSCGESEGIVTVHYGIIGCGMMGQEHIKNIALLASRGDAAEVSVIFEPDSAMLSAARELVPGAEVASSLGDLLGHRPLDCLVIASPNHCHVDQLEAIAERVSVPILVEKPLFTRLEDLSRIERFKSAYRGAVWVAMEYRYMPPLQAFIGRVGAATGGVKMLTITEHRFPFLEKVGDWNRFNRNSGGTFVEKGCHFFDLMRLMMGSVPVRIMASGGQVVNHVGEVYGGEASDIWDCGYVLVDFASGGRAMLELSMFAEGSEYQEMVHAIGGAGKLELKLPGPRRFWSGAGPPPIAKLIESPRHACTPKEILCPIDETLLAAGDHNGATFYQHQRFLEVVRHDTQIEVGLDDGIWAVRMGLAAEESARSGRAIDLVAY